MARNFFRRVYIQWKNKNKTKQNKNKKQTNLCSKFKLAIILRQQDYASEFESTEFLMLRHQKLENATYFVKLTALFLQKSLESMRKLFLNLLTIQYAWKNCSSGHLISDIPLRQSDKDMMLTKSRCSLMSHFYVYPITTTSLLIAVKKGIFTALMSNERPFYRLVIKIIQITENTSEDIQRI